MPAQDFAERRRRALYRATHRGSKELDFLLGRFAEQSIPSMSDAEIEILERLIDVPDPEIAAAFYEGEQLDKPELDTLIERLRRFHGYEVKKTG